MRKRIFILLAVIVLVVVVIIPFGIYFKPIFNYLLLKPNSESTTAYVLAIETIQKNYLGDTYPESVVDIAYTVDDVEYITTLTHRTESMRVGATVEIFYDKDDVTKVTVKPDSSRVMFFVCLLIFVGFSVYLFVGGKKQALEEQRLKKEGTPVQCEIVDIRATGKRSYNRYKVSCAKIDETTKTKYIYTTYYTQRLKCYVIGDKVTVYIDPNDEHHYVVDLV